MITHENLKGSYSSESNHSFISNVSFIAEKSASELANLLKNAYKSLREKERDLILVAEIGKSLLEHNQSLKTDYDKLLQNVSSLNESSGDSDMQLLSNKKAFDKMIEALQYKNEEIQSLLNNANQNSHISQKTHEKNKRKLESEIEVLQLSLESAAQKIQELEQQNLIGQERANRQYESRIEQRHKEDIVLLQELSCKMDELHRENGFLLNSKKTLEDKLKITLKDLEMLGKEFEQFEMTHQGYLSLQEAFRRQNFHVKELNQRLEEYQVILSHYSDQNTPDNSNLMHELDSADKNTCSKLYDFASLTEKNLASFYNAPADYAFDTILSTVGIGDRTALQEVEKLLWEDPELFGPQTQKIYAEFDLYPPLVCNDDNNSKQLETQNIGLIHRILIRIRHLFHSVFRWCRFALILVTAIMINLWKGPDIILDK